jgi:hypothetical protein
MDWKLRSIHTTQSGDCADFVRLHRRSPKPAAFLWLPLAYLNGINCKRSVYHCKSSFPEASAVF